MDYCTFEILRKVKSIGFQEYSKIINIGLMQMFVLFLALDGIAKMSKKLTVTFILEMLQILVFLKVARTFSWLSEFF